MAYFCLASLALLPSSAVASTDESLSALEVMLKPAQIQGFRDWVYEQQMPAGGFRGSDALAAAGLSAEQACTTDPANVIQTYTALCVLGLLGDDYSRLDRSGLKRFLGECQNEDGSWVPHPLSEPSSLRDQMQCSRSPFRHSFSQFPGCEEPGDPRSSYSAFAVASMLDEWDFIDVDQGLAFLECCRVRTGHRNLCFRESSKCASCRATKALMLKDPVSKPTVRLASPSESSRDSPFELTRRNTAGPTYCAIAAYSLASRLHTIPEPDDLLRWLVDRQVPPPPSSPSETDSDSETEGATAEAASPDAPPAAAPTATGATSDAAASQQSSSRTTIGVAGFQGRANKPTDACYSFWNTAALTVRPLSRQCRSASEPPLPGRDCLSFPLARRFSSRPSRLN